MGFFGVLVREWEARKASKELHIDKKLLKNYVLCVKAKKRKLTRDYAIYKVHNKYGTNFMILISV